MTNENRIKTEALNEVINLFKYADQNSFDNYEAVTLVQSLLPKEEAIDWSKASDEDRMDFAVKNYSKGTTIKKWGNAEGCFILRQPFKLWCGSIIDQNGVCVYSEQYGKFAEIIPDRQIKEPVIHEVKSEPTQEIKDERYNMCKDQLAQIDCRNSDCLFYESGNCNNISPAITLNPDKTFVCWSKKEQKTQEEMDWNWVKESLSNHSQTADSLDDLLFKAINYGRKTKQD